MLSCCITTRRSPNTRFLLCKYKSTRFSPLTVALPWAFQFHYSACVKIMGQVTELLWDKYFRWREWKQEERYKSYNRSPHEIKSQVLYSLHTPRSDESWFNGLSCQQGSITPQWFSSTWKAKRGAESGNGWGLQITHTHATHTHRRTHALLFLPFPRTVTATASVISQYCRRKKLYASSGCQHPLLTQLLDMLLL